jgi:FAD/FMN-containing dehydrogenase
MFDAGDADAARRATAATERVFAAATAGGGSITGEHGVGTVKVPHLPKQFSPSVLELQREVKRLFDPKNLLNPGKKTG